MRDDRAKLDSCVAGGVIEERRFPNRQSNLARGSNGNVRRIAKAECGLTTALIRPESYRMQPKPLAGANAYRGKSGPLWPKAIEIPPARTVSAKKL